MARYSRVALYHKAQNAAHNQTNKLKQSPFKKTLVQIPEAQHTADSEGAVHKEPHTTEHLLTPVVKGRNIENGKEKKSRSHTGSKKMSKKAALVSKIKNTPLSKRASASKTKQSAAKAASKKTMKKSAAAPKSAAKSPARKIASKAKTANKITTKKKAPKRNAK